MSTSGGPISSPTAMATPMAAIEILGLLGAISVATLCFVLAWLTPEQAAVLTLALLLCLDVLAWKRFDQGRHPCFLFLCILTVLQAGKFIGYCAGIGPYPLRVGGIFPLTRSTFRAETPAPCC